MEGNGSAADVKKVKNLRGIVKLCIAGGLLLLSALLMLVFHRFPDAFFPAYRSFSKKLMGGLSVLTSFVPFTVWDIGFILLIVLFLYTMIRMIVRKKSFLNWIGTVFLAASVLLGIAVNGWMLNHYGPLLSEEIGLTVEEYTEDELAETFLYYYTKAAECAAEIEREEDGSAVRQDFGELARICGASYHGLQDRYPVFEGSEKPVKYVGVFGELMLYSGITGIFMPITGESGIPKNEVVVNQPFTMCHEAAHRLGIASEEEANFAAYLACEASEDVRLRYSGYYSAFIFTYNALYKANSGKLEKILKKYHEDGYALVLNDSDTASDYYEQYDSPLQEVETKVNDTYLKTFSEEKGVQSYGAVADDLIAWYLSQYKKGK